MFRRMYSTLRVAVRVSGIRGSILLVERKGRFGLETDETTVPRHIELPASR